MLNEDENNADNKQYPVVSVKWYWYVVDYGPAAVGLTIHNVGKNKECTCRLKSSCPAVQAVVQYLRHGGQRAPELASDYWLTIPRTCPICTGDVRPDPALNSTRHGKGWACLKDKRHYWNARQKFI